MPPLRIPPALRWALRHGKEAAASMGNVTVYTDPSSCVGVVPFSIATVCKAYHTEQGGGSNISPLPLKPPETIPWHPFLCNRIDIIGHIVQDVDIKYLDSGRTRGTSVLRDSMPDGQPMWFVVEFWDELAEMASTHTKTHSHVHVAGLLHVVDILDKGRKIRFRWKVTATQLNLVMREVQAGNESKEGKCPLRDGDLRMSTHTYVEALGADVEKSAVHDESRMGRSR